MERFSTHLLGGTRGEALKVNVFTEENENEFSQEII